jgi:hypothetical protein
VPEPGSGGPKTMHGKIVATLKVQSGLAAKFITFISANVLLYTT